jgi:hypothetical protein
MFLRLEPDLGEFYLNEELLWINCIQEISRTNLGCSLTKFCFCFAPHRCLPKEITQ